MDNVIHPISLCPLNSAIGFPNTYPLDNDLSGGKRHPPFEQPGPDQKRQVLNNTHCSTKNMLFSIPQKLAAFFSTNQAVHFFLIRTPHHVRPTLLISQRSPIQNTNIFLVKWFLVGTSFKRLLDARSDRYVRCMYYATQSIQRTFSGNTDFNIS